MDTKTCPHKNRYYCTLIWKHKCQDCGKALSPDEITELTKKEETGNMDKHEIATTNYIPGLPEMAKQIVDCLAKGTDDVIRKALVMAFGDNWEASLDSSRLGVLYLSGGAQRLLVDGKPLVELESAKYDSAGGQLGGPPFLSTTITASVKYKYLWEETKETQ